MNLDVSSIQWFRLGQVEMVPCIITGSKYYVTSLGRYMTAIESLKFQGVPWKRYDFSGYDDSSIIKFAGNTMSVNVLSALFKELFATMAFK